MLEHTLLGRLLKVALQLTVVLLLAGLAGMLGIALVAGRSPHGVLEVIQGYCAATARVGVYAACTELALVIAVMCIPEPVLRRWTNTPDTTSELTPPASP